MSRGAKDTRPSKGPTSPHLRRYLAQIFGIPETRIRVVKPRIGGGFGCKQEVLLEDVVAMFALRTGRPQPNGQQST